MSGMKKILLVMGIGMLAALAGCAGKDNENAGQVVENIVLEDKISDVETTEGVLSENGISENATSESDVSFTMEEVKALDIPEDMLAYWLVLNNKIPFASYDEGGQEFYWNEYFWFLGEPTHAVAYENENLFWGDPSSFIIVDMNNDGRNEIVLDLVPGAVQILHYEDGIVYGYQFMFRMMNGIRINGIYEGSDGADYAYYYRLTELSRDGYEEEKIAEENHRIDYHEVMGRSVSYEEYMEYRQTIDEVELAETIDYTEAMLDDYLLEGLSEDELYMVKHVAVEPMTDTTEYTMEPEIMQTYYEVLMSEKEFISVTDNNQVFYLNNYHQWYGGYNEDYQILYFSIVDMEQDGVYEVVLSSSLGSTQILHYEDGKVYNYQFLGFPNDLGAIANSGIFCMDYLRYSPDKYGRIVSFDEDGCVIEEVDYNGNINDDRIRYYYFSEELIEKYFR